jgi:hypothetical protein
MLVVNESTRQFRQSECARGSGASMQQTATALTGHNKVTPYDTIFTFKDFKPAVKGQTM